MPEITINAEWIYGKLTEICAAVKVIPRIEKHLERINGTIDALQERFTDHEYRIRQLEEGQQTAKANWMQVVDVVLRIATPFAVAWLVYQSGIK